MNQGLRRAVRKRAAERCEYCLLPQTAVLLRFQIDHVTPRQHGGNDDLANLALACDQCNRLKGPNMASVDPATRKMVRLFNPRRDDWQRHFRVSGAEIVGLTSVGRATVQLLKINLEERLVLRQHLLDNGEFSIR